MKLKLFTVIAGAFLLTIPKAYAIEHVISVGVGGGFTNNELEQSITTEHKNSTTGQVEQNNISRQFDSKYYGPNFNVEYQARFNLITLGIGINNNNPLIKTTYNSDKNNDVTIKLQSHYVDTYIAVLWNAVKINSFTLAVGPSLGIGYFKVDSSNDYLNNGKNTGQFYISPKVVLDGEYNIDNHFALYTRLNLFPSFLLKKITYNTNLHTATDEANSIVSNTMQLKHNTYFNVNFGVRYKF